MADAFDAAAAAADIKDTVAKLGAAAAPAFPPAVPLPLFREDHKGNLVTRAGVLVREKIPPLQLGPKKE